MVRGWEVEYKDGTVLTEEKIGTWRAVPKKKDIVRLTLKFDGRRWNIRNKDAYFVKYRASQIPGIPESLRLEARMIGFYEGNKKVIYELNEFTGEMKLKIIEG